MAELKSPKDYVEFGLEMGLTKEQIIAGMTINKSGPAVIAFARKYSKALGMTVTEIRRAAGRIR